MLPDGRSLLLLVGLYELLFALYLLSRVTLYRRVHRHLDRRLQHLVGLLADYQDLLHVMHAFERRLGRDRAADEAVDFGLERDAAFPSSEAAPDWLTAYLWACSTSPSSVDERSFLFDQLEGDSEDGTEPLNPFMPDEIPW